MASGIYKLVFGNGDTYIGKSVDIEQRWAQHWIKIQKGTAARPVLEAFNASGGVYKASAILYCHPDLLDEYEGMYINLLAPELNTSIPPRREKWEYDQLIKYTETEDGPLNGVPALINTVFALNETVEDLKLARARAVRELGELKSNWDDQEFKEISKEEAYGRIQDEAWEGVELAKRMMRQAQDDLHNFRVKVNGANWWQRLWKSW